MKNKYLFKEKLFFLLAFVVPALCHGATATPKDEDRNMSCGNICQSVRHIFIIQNNNTEVNFDPVKNVVRDAISRKINIVRKVPTDGRPEPFNLHSGMTKRNKSDDEQHKFSISPKQVKFILDFRHDECSNIDIKIDVKLLSENAFY